MMERMSLIYRKRFVLILILAVFGIVGKAQTYTESKRIIRSFPTDPDTRLDITNKYGKIHVIPWKKDSVSVEVDLFIKSNSTRKLEKIQDNIDFEFTATKYYIIARTVFDTKYGNFFTDLKDLSGTIIPPKNQVNIDYTVRVPSSLNINISNKYGDIYIDDLKGAVNVSLSNGDIKVNNLEGESNINLNFGNGVINFLQNAKLTLAYTDFEIKSADQININSRSSKIKIEEANILSIQSRRDKFTITKLDNLFGDSYFSDLWIYKLNEEVNYAPKYGDIKIDTVARQFSYININSEYTDINFIFNRTAPFEMEITFHPDAIIRYPEINSDVKTIYEEKEEIKIAGSVGTGKTSAKVKILAPKKCIIDIRQR